jgi:DNA polymerase-3 subunit epsilon
VKTELDLSGWLTRVGQPIDLSKGSSSNISREGNPEGELYGQSMVFTGTLAIPRNIAADMASRIGCTIASGVTKKTNYLVVGDQDITKLAGKKLSSKHVKAEQLIEKGQDIRILKESDFKELVESVN